MPLAGMASAMRVIGVDPDFFRLFDRVQVEVDDDRFLIAANKDTDQRLVGFGVDLLMGNEGRDIDEVAGFGFGKVFEVVAPAHPGTPAEDVDDALQFAVMMRAGFGVGLDADCPGPEFIGPGFGVVDGSGTGHALGLGRVHVEVGAFDDAHAVLAPVGFIGHGYIFRHYKLLSHS